MVERTAERDGGLSQSIVRDSRSLAACHLVDLLKHAYERRTHGCDDALVRPHYHKSMKSDASSFLVVHNANLNRFEVLTAGQLAYAKYYFKGDVVVFAHTFVPEALRGTGLASTLVRAALSQARQEHWKILPSCSYVAHFIECNPEFADLVSRHSQAYGLNRRTDVPAMFGPISAAVFQVPSAD